MLRKYAYLVALARERHFGRAAAACHVTQPTLSNAIRQLEDALGVPIVERGQSFRGFTPQGETVLAHARRMLAEQDALTQALRDRGAGLGGTARLGVIPTALPAVAHLLGAFAERHPAARVVVRSMNSREIERGLGTFDLDAGITYLDNEPPAHVRPVPLFTEAPVFLCRRVWLQAGAQAAEGADGIPWADAAAHPLCLLTPDMQNRRIVEAAFGAAGVAVDPGVETNSLMTLYSLVRRGPWASVLPALLLTTLRPDPDVVTLPLVRPACRHTVGLVIADREPPAPLARALFDLARAVPWPDAIGGPPLRAGGTSD